MPTTTRGHRRDGWHRPVALPEQLEDLRGPVCGSVRLPLRTYSSGAGPDRVFDLDNEAERIELYQIVITDGTVEDISRYLNHTELLRLWTRLWLPAHARRAWEPLLGLAAS